MEAIGLLVTLGARSGKEADAQAFLESAQPLALNERRTLNGMRSFAHATRSMTRLLDSCLSRVGAQSHGGPV
jgi:hypothetical protein